MLQYCTAQPAGQNNVKVLYLKVRHSLPEPLTKGMVLYSIVILYVHVCIFLPIPLFYLPPVLDQVVSLSEVSLPAAIEIAENAMKDGSSNRKVPSEGSSQDSFEYPTASPDLDVLKGNFDTDFVDELCRQIGRDFFLYGS